MNTLKIANVTVNELIELQNQTHFYQQALEHNLKHDIADFYNSIISLDIALKIWFLLRGRIEKTQPKNGFTIALKPAEAAVLFKICLTEQQYISEYRLHVIRKYRNDLDQQLKSII